ncbi:aminotransferase class I/II-fold pyridoxal phosphate-dependent enzyme [Candidatus Leptofilum sp.]|uniref:aminotransferase class I/II-fold pyridoxal phosphate-dependent enzyme n=1 Tax=Candidatus Leptofilum sp. TaxID=3241576 RepID=UPI003B5C7B37
MQIQAFETEHFFARYEFNTPYLLCSSDCETMTVRALLDLAGKSLEGLGALHLGYTESQGNPELRSAIARTHAAGVVPDDVVVLGSPIEGIYIAAQAMLQPGDEVVVLTPAYDALINLFEHIVGASNVKRWHFSPTDGQWTLSLDALRALLTPRTRLVVVNFPHNPTGFLPTRQFQADLVQIIEERGIYLFYDEMYFGLVQPGVEPVPSAADLSERAVVLSGLSKTHGLPGLRCGWLVVRDEQLRASLINWKFYTSICPPAPTEFLALTALEVLDTLRDRNIRRITANLELADAFFERWPHLFDWRRPVAGSTALVGFNVPSVSALVPMVAEDAGVLIHPAATLGSDDQHVRFGFGRDMFGEGLKRFEQWLQDDPRGVLQ